MVSLWTASGNVMLLCDESLQEPVRAYGHALNQVVWREIGDVEVNEHLEMRRQPSWPQRAKRWRPDARPPRFVREGGGDALVFLLTSPCPVLESPRHAAPPGSCPSS